MSLVDEPIQRIGNRLFEFADNTFRREGFISPVLVGIRLSNDTSPEIVVADTSSDLRIDFRQKLSKLERQFPAVGFIAESWTSPADGAISAAHHPDRQEVVVTHLSVRGKQYAAHHRIDRQQARLIEAPLHKVLGVRSRRQGESVGIATADDAKRAAQQLRRILKNPVSGWKERMRSQILRFIQTDYVRELVEVIYDRSLPEEETMAANKFMERAFSILPFDDPTRPSSRPVAWLTGLSVRCTFATTSGDVNVDELTSALGRILPKAAQMSGLPFFVSPGCRAYTVCDLVAVSLARNIILLGLAWDEEPPDSLIHPLVSEALRVRNQESFAHNDMVRRIRGSHSGAIDVDFIVFGVVLDYSESSRDAYDVDATRRWGAEVDLKNLRYLELVAASLGKEVGAEVQFTGLAPIFDALHELRDTHLNRHLDAVLHVAREKTGANEIFVELSGVRYPGPPHPHERAMVTFWQKDGGYVLSAQEQYRPWEKRGDLLEKIATHLQKAGLKDVRVHPEWLTAPSEIVDETGKLMFPDLEGGWFSPTLRLFPEAKGVLQRMEWSYPDREAVQDPALRRLPLPHRWLRLGLIDVLRRHYAPRVYSGLRDIMADVSVPDEVALDRLIDKVPNYGALLDKYPDLAIPDPLTFNAARLHWGKGPTLTVTQSLSERLSLTDLDSDIPASYIQSPYSLVYIHFPWPIKDASIVAEGPDDKDVPMDLVGAFVKQYPGPPRRLVLELVWCVKEQLVSALVSHVSLDITDESQPLNLFLDRHYQNLGEEQSHAESEFGAVMTVVKVLIYLAMREARTFDVPERSMALRGLGKKSPEHQQKELQKARSLYDYIRVGPEEPLDTVTLYSGSGRTVAPHFRRGHIHTYRVGPGRTRVELKFVNPVIVNKKLLTEESVVTPRDYSIE